MQELVNLMCPKCRQTLFSVSIKTEELNIQKGQMIDSNVLDLINESTKRVLQQEIFLSSV